MKITIEFADRRIRAARFDGCNHLADFDLVTARIREALSDVLTGKDECSGPYAVEITTIREMGVDATVRMDPMHRAAMAHNSGGWMQD